MTYQLIDLYTSKVLGEYATLAEADVTNHISFMNLMKFVMRLKHQLNLKLRKLNDKQESN